VYAVVELQAGAEQEDEDDVQVPELHVFPEAHVPQLPPQPSVPQFLPEQFGVQVPPPHTPLSVHTVPHGQPLPPGAQLL